MPAPTLTAAIDKARAGVADAYNLGYADGVDSATVSTSAKVSNLEARIRELEQVNRSLVADL